MLRPVAGAVKRQKCGLIQSLKRNEREIMDTKEKGALISKIVTELKLSAFANKDTSFCEGDTFFSLAFKSDNEINKIARLCGIS